MTSQYDRKRVKIDLPDNFDFRYKRRTLNSVVDVLKTSEDISTESHAIHDIIPSVIDLAVGLQRISVFYLLNEELDIPFSLDNGVVNKTRHATLMHCFVPVATTSLLVNDFIQN